MSKIPYGHLKVNEHLKISISKAVAISKPESSLSLAPSCNPKYFIVLNFCLCK